MNKKELIREFFIASNRLGELCSEIIIKDENPNETDIRQVKHSIELLHRKAESLSEQDIVVEKPISIVTPEVEIEPKIEESIKQEAPFETAEVQVEKPFEVEITPEVEETIIKEEAKEEVPEQIEKDVQNTASSLHEKIQDQIDTEAVVDRLQQQPIENLTSGIDLNDSFVYISELFNGDKETYDKTIKHLDEMNKKEDALDYINTSLATKHNWDSKADTTVKFINLVERRYN